MRGKADWGGCAPPEKVEAKPYSANGIPFGTEPACKRHRETERNKERERERDRERDRETETERESDYLRRRASRAFPRLRWLEHRVGVIFVCGVVVDALHIPEPRTQAKKTR